MFLLEEIYQIIQDGLEMVALESRCTRQLFERHLNRHDEMSAKDEKAQHDKKQLTKIKVMAE